MISINLPEPTFRRMELVAEPRREKGGKALLDAVSWIELADPQHVRVSNKSVADDPELQKFLDAENGAHRYDYIRLGCTFCPRNFERFEKAWLHVNLALESSQVGEVPISWSLFPLTQFETGKHNASAKISVPVRIVNAEVSVSSEVPTSIYSVRGYGEGLPDPFWELYSNQSSSLDGSMRFHMIVRSRPTSYTVGAVRLEAVISNRTFVVFREKRPFDQTPSAEFRLVPE